MDEAFTGKLSGQAAEKNEEKKEQIHNIFLSKVENGNDYTVLAAANMVTTKKLTKEVRTYYNYIIGYRDGDDPEIVVLSTTDDLSSVGDPIHCKKSECIKAGDEKNIGDFRIWHPAFGKDPLILHICVSAYSQLGTMEIKVSYLDEFYPFQEFFQNRFTKK